MMRRPLPTDTVGLHEIVERPIVGATGRSPTLKPNNASSHKIGTYVPIIDPDVCYSVFGSVRLPP